MDPEGFDRSDPRPAVVIELGPGPQRRRADAIGIDRRFAFADVVADLERGLPFLPDASVDEIHAHHLLEHVEALDGLLADCFRVLRPGGRLVGSVPHFSNPYFWSDPTHRRAFGLYTLAYYATDAPLARQVPRYAPTGFCCRELRLGFRSPFRRRNRLKGLVERLVNRSPWTMELYEENLCYLVPAYELHFVLEKPP